MEQKWETISEGVGFPILAPGPDNDNDKLLKKGETLTGKIVGVSHDEDVYKGVRQGRKTMILIKIETAVLHKELVGKTYKHYLRRSRREAFMAAEWGVNDTLSIQYDGVAEYTGKGIPPHLLVYKGLKAENSKFVPDHYVETAPQMGAEVDKTNSETQQKQWTNKQPPTFNPPQFGGSQ